MRYYDISITDPSSGGNALIHYTSHPNGVQQPPDRGALQVELDLWTLAQADARADSYLKIWGIPLTEISNSINLNPTSSTGPKNIIVMGGMGKGLPLANPAQAGILVQGQVKQAFGNWVGVNMTLDVLINSGMIGGTVSGATTTTSAGGPATKPNLVFNYKAGGAFSTAIKNTLQTAFPGMTTNVNISSDLTLNYDQPGFYEDVPQFAEYIKNVSLAIKNDVNYPGVDISINQNTIDVHDGTTVGTAKQISFADLVGQPTWVEPLTIQIKCVMRSDIQPGQYVTLPPSLVTTQAAAFSGLAGMRLGPVFSGQFYVNKVHHVGNYKSPEGEAWTTDLFCSLQTATSTTVSDQQALITAGAF